MPIILGIDPGLLHTGWGVISAEGNSIRYLSSGTISPTAKLPLPERLHHIYLELKQVIANYHPDQCAVEEVFVNKNSGSSLKLGHARGVALLSGATCGIPINEYATTLVKKSIVGVGRAEKHQVEMMVRHLLPGCKVDSSDAADALAVAICHFSHSSLKAKIKSS